jgi:putative ABC transport system permease protein
VFRITLKGLLANKVRLLLTSLAIVLGVGFISGSFVLADTLNKTFDNLFASAFEGIDVIVQSEPTVSRDQLAPIPEDVLAPVREVDGVRAADGGVSGQAVLVKDGEAIDLNGAPALGFSWDDDPELSSFQLREGRAPEGPDEIVIDAGTAGDQGFAIGDRASVITTGPAQPYTIVGIVSFGDEDNLAGASSTLFALPTAQRVFGKEGVFDSIAVAADDGITADELIDRLEPVLPAGVEAITAKSEEDRQSQDLQDQLSFLTYFLLGFAGVAVFVAAFVIFNTFTITVAQRTRQLALLRAVGASGSQVIRMVMGEALVIGVIASLAGLFLGLGIAALLQSAFSAFGFELPTTSLQFEPRTWIVAMVVGIGVTLIAAIMPARRAASISPVEGLRGTVAHESSASLGRVAVAVAVTVVGFAMFFGARSIPDTQTLFLVLGVGAVVAFIGAAMIAQVVARPLARAIGAPLPRLFKVPGKLGRENAMRDPRRTARTASALMIGLAVVGVVSIISASITSTIDQFLDEQFPAEFIVRTDNFTTFPPAVATAIAQEPLVTDVAEVRSGSTEALESEMRLDGAVKTVSGVDPSVIGAVHDPKFVEGDWTDLRSGGVLVTEDVADDLDVSVGDVVPGRFVLGGEREFRIDGIFEEATFSDVFVTIADYEEGYPVQEAFAVFANAAPGADLDAAQAQIEQALQPFPLVMVENQQEYKEAQQEQLNALLGLVYVLLALTIIIAIFGIVNTLALTIYERTREIGLLRAVGLSSRQARAMVRWESVIVALIGAVLGTVLGIVFGAWLADSIPDLTTISIPWGSLVIFLVLAGVAGVLAAIAPARRAAKLDVLKAIAQE